MSSIPFISWLGHGASNLAPPGVFTDAKANLFTVDADGGSIQRLADALLNRVNPRAVRYEAVLPVAMLSFMDIARCTSATDVVGWLPGRECAIWVPLLEIHPGHPFDTRLVFWAPYIFIDYCIGMVTGREVWGWPKAGAQIHVASDPPHKPEFSCTTTLFPTLTANTRGRRDVLYKVVAADAAIKSSSAWHSGPEAAAGLMNTLFPRLAADLVQALLLRPQLPCVVLKQFRSAAAPDQACFQSIVDSPIVITGFIGGGLLVNTFTVEITTCASHAVVRDLLGRPPNPGSTALPVTAAAWVTVDFQAVAGRDIALAG